MKKYRFAFPKSTFVVFALIVAAAVVAIVFASLRLAEVGDFLSVYPATDIVTIVAFVAFLALVGWDLFGSYYAFDEQVFIAAQLFSRKKIACELFVKLVIDEESSLAVLYYCDAAVPDALLYVVVRIAKKNLESFVFDLRDFKSDIVVEYNLPDKDDKADGEGEE